ncbi:hypothetical protein ABT246_40855 [Streptomyces sp. NPDC001553]|uniref:hypothetical protein n=1 Tax=Streptomyces sp. NPDC001553 TaxID=3154385 RepID=UPI0033320D8F
MTTAAPRTVLERFPAGHPRGSCHADEYAAAQRAQGTDARIVMGLGSDEFLVITDTTPPVRLRGEHERERDRHVQDHPLHRRRVALTPGGNVLLIERGWPPDEGAWALPEQLAFDHATIISATVIPTS